jgi:hypothetical protein
MPITFVKASGGNGNDHGRSIIKTNDGGYAVTGYTNSYNPLNAYEMFIAKYDLNGTLIWNKNLDESYGYAYGHSIVQTSDGGYAVTGETNSRGNGSIDMFIIKFNSNGDIVWTKTWHAIGGINTNQIGRSIVQTSDGGYAVTGETNIVNSGGNMFIVKYDSNGNVIWNKIWGGVNYEVGNSIIQTSDGGYAIAGETGYGAGMGDALIVKYNSGGNLVWSRTLGGSMYDKGYSIIQTNDGGYAVTGETSSYGAGGYDMFIAKYDSSGNISWNKTWGGSMNDKGYSIIQTSDGGYAVTGEAYSFSVSSQDYDMFIAKYDSNGNISWNKTWGGIYGANGTNGTDMGRSIVQTSDGGYAVSGETNSFGAGGYDMFIAKYNSSGILVNCTSTMCQSPSATTTTPSATATNPASDYDSVTATVNSLNLTINNQAVTNTVIVAP